MSAALAINPPSDIVLGVANAADPQKLRAAAAQLARAGERRPPWMRRPGPATDAGAEPGALAVASKGLPVFDPQANGATPPTAAQAHGRRLQADAGRLHEIRSLPCPDLRGIHAAERRARCVWQRHGRAKSGSPCWPSTSRTRWPKAPHSASRTGSPRTAQQGQGRSAGRRPAIAARTPPTDADRQGRALLREPSSAPARPRRRGCAARSGVDAMAPEPPPKPYPRPVLHAAWRTNIAVPDYGRPAARSAQPRRSGADSLRGIIEAAVSRLAEILEEETDGAAQPSAHRSEGVERAQEPRPDRAEPRSAPDGRDEAGPGDVAASWKG